MSSARRFIAVVDTNTVWCESVGRLFSVKSENEWSRFKATSDVVLLVPEIVLEERCHQAVAELSRKHNEARLALESLSAALEREMPKVEFSKEEATTILRTRFRKQASELGGACVFETPFEAIGVRGLARITDQATWRSAPFKTGKKEQGFRDAIVSETALTIARQYQSYDVGIITADTRLRKGQLSLTL